ncbi:MAG TPA: FAD:protein FMN transferase [Woeseiaceae bacterium]|nr:FAD:protein FMN transferase [Woeseiaceae bacterium]
MRYLPYVTLAIVALLPSACGNEPAVLELNGSTMGTRFSIKVPADEPVPDAGLLQQQIDAVLARIEGTMSTYIIDSELSLFNISESTDWQPVSAEFCLSVEESLAISALTGGAFDITVGPLVNLWGFGPDGTAVKPPSDEQINAARARVGYGHLQTDCAKPAMRKNLPDLYIDLSAYAKGYAVDRIAELLDEQGIENYLVEIGGELRMRGHNAARELWAVAIEEPLDDARRVHSVVHMTDRAVATSGDYRNFFEFDKQRYSHTIDTRTGRPVTHSLASVTVIADTAAYADAMATALMVLGPDEGLQLATSQGIAALFLVRTEAGFSEHVTPAFVPEGPTI